MNNQPSEKIFHGSPESLRSPERIARLEIGRVTELTIQGISVNRLLDIGTGSGIFAEAFAQSIPHICGIDISETMLSFAHQRIPNVRFQQARMESLPFANKSFDCIFFGLALHESNTLHQTLSEASRCSKQRVVALEWQYKEEPSGPPLAHRLQPDNVAWIAKDLGFSQIEIIPLTNLILYRLTIHPL